MAENRPISFADHAPKARARLQEKGVLPAGDVPQPAPLAEKEVTEPVVELATHRARLREVAERDGIAVPERSSRVGRSSMLTLAINPRSLDGHRSNNPIRTEEDRKKFTRLQEVVACLRILRAAMSVTKERQNVLLRRKTMRDAETNDLADQFWKSTERDWTQNVSIYLALLEELEARGFFDFQSPQTPPRGRVFDEHVFGPDDEPEGSPRSPGRRHRRRPKK